MSMREKYQSLALTDLKAIAKSRGIKGTSSMKKADVIDAMVALDEAEGAGKETSENAVSEKEASEKAASEKGASAKDAPVKAEKAGAKEAAAKEAFDKKRTVKKTSAPSADGGREKGAAMQAASTAASAAPAASEAAASAVPAAAGTAAGTAAPATAASTAPAASAAAASAAPAARAAAGTAAQAAEQAKNEKSENRAEGRSEGRTENRSEGRRTVIYTAGNAGGNSGGEGVAEKKTAYRNQNSGTQNTNNQQALTGTDEEKYPAELDSGYTANGILEVMPDGYGFIRCANYLPGENDVYVAPSQIRRFGLKTGDILVGNTRIKTQNEKFSALLYVKTINGYTPDVAMKRKNFEDMTPIFPDERIRLELSRSSVAMRIMDLMSPVGKGQRGMIVSPPKAGKTTLLKQVAQSVKTNNPDMHLIILLIDERPEEVTDFKEAIEGPNVEVIYSTFDELPEHHKRVSEMVIERAKRLVEHKKDVMILLDSITRLTRAYNLVIPPSGRTLSGGLDPAALHMPKRFFGAARNMRGGGSLTILASALVDTGSRMDDVIYEEFKGTGNMEIVLDRKLSEKRVFPAIDIPKSGTRRDDLLLTAEEQEAMAILRKGLNGLKPDESVDKILDMFTRTKNNEEFVNMVKKIKFI